MGLFNRKKKEDDGNVKNQNGPKEVAAANEKLTKDDKQRYKQRSSAVHDPILTAVNEDQPFQTAMGHMEGTISPEARVRDVFGNAIADPDRSNPTRNRNERPLATVRGFEYSATGDPNCLAQINQDQQPWQNRKFQYNPNAMNGQGAGIYGGGYGRNGGPNGYGDPNEYDQPQERRIISLGGTAGATPSDSGFDVPAQKKKKKGLFGGKNKDKKKKDKAPVLPQETVA